MARFGIADLIDLECRYLADRNADPQTVDERDRRFISTLERFPQSRSELVLAWLRNTGEDLPGRRSLTAVRRLGGIAWLGAALLGAMFASGVLSGRHVDLMVAVGLLLGLQMIFLLVLLLAPLLQLGAGPLVDVCYAGLTRIGPLHSWIERVMPQGGLALLRVRLQQHRRCLSWFFLGLIQRVAVAYNAGMLLALGLRVTFSDLRFAWGTSLPKAEQADRILAWSQTLAMPWAWLWEQAVPDRALVLGSLDTVSAALDSRWWPWLFMLLLVYGLLPRLLLANLAAWRCRKQLDRLPGHDAEALALHQRLSDAFHLQAGDGQRGNAKETALDQSALTSTTYQRMRPLRWLACPISAEESAAFILRRFHIHGEGLRELPDFLQQPSDDPADCAWLLLVEAWQVPSRKCLRHLRSLREVAGVERAILVVLLAGEAGSWAPPDEQRLALWQSQLATLADPYLRVEGYRS